MLKLVGGYNTFEKVFRLYFDEVTDKFVDGWGKVYQNFDLKMLYKSLGKTSTDISASRFLIRQERSEWFCEYEKRYDEQTDLFIITYGQTPEEALHKCIELIEV